MSKEIETFRIGIMIDVDATSLKEAYKRVYNTMGEVSMSEGDIDWESSDEWFDEDGQMLNEDEVSSIRLEALKELEEENN